MNIASFSEGFVWGVTAVVMFIFGATAWTLKKFERDFRQRRLESAKRVIESVLVAEQLSKHGLEHRIWMPLSPLFGPSASTIVVDKSDSFYNAVTLHEYPKILVTFISDERVLPGSRILVEVARDSLSGEILEIKPCPVVRADSQIQSAV